MQKRAEAAEAVVSGVKNHFGEEAKAEDFDVVNAVSSLGAPDAESETKVTNLESQLATANARIAELEKASGATKTTATAKTDGGKEDGAGAASSEEIITGTKNLFAFVTGQ